MKTKLPTMTAAELFHKFQSLWQAGTDARLSLECHAGEAWMNLQVHLSRPPPPHPLHKQHPPPPFNRQQQPRKSPSRLRRRARRAEARASKIAADRNVTTADASVQTATSVADNLAPSTINIPAPSHGDSCVLLQHHHQAAGAVRPPDVEGQEQHQAGQDRHGQHIPPDVFCPDDIYLQSISAVPQYSQLPPQDKLPQLDGNDEEEDEEFSVEWINPNPTSGLWHCRCCTYAHTFTTEKELEEHHDTLIIEYNECNVCYPWHVWT